MNDNHITNRMYRYDALIKAIDFFTQRFSPEQLSEYSFDFANEILTLHASALFIKEGNIFKLRNKRLYDFNDYSIKNNIKLQKIATLHGSIILNHFNVYFDEREIAYLKMGIVIPLIIDDLLFGFIIADGKVMGSFDEEDFTMAKALMRLFNNSLENSRNFLHLKEKNKQLDEKVFNLFAINQSAKSLLLELEIDRLKNMAVDVFGEIACSSITSFGMMDDINNTLKILGYRNVGNFSTFLTEIKVNQDINLDSNKIVLNFKKDVELIKKIFVNWEEFQLLGAKYIVLLVRDKLIGLVTLGDPINQTYYDDSTFELIESLASFTYIALKNAMMFEEISKQKEIIEAKYNTLHKLNMLINNINECISIEELCDITLKTLNISFGIQTAFIAFAEENHYKIMWSIDDIGLGETFEINEEWKNTFEGDTIYNFAAESIHNYLNEGLCSLLQNTTGIVISPIALNKLNIEHSGPLAYLVILRTSNNLQQEEIILIDTVAKNISPIIHHMVMLEEQEKNYLPNNRKLFYESICSKIEDRNKYHIDFHVYYKILKKHPFLEPNLSIYQDYEHYLIENYLFVVSYEDLNLIDFEKMSNIDSFEDISMYDFIKSDGYTEGLSN